MSFRTVFWLLLMFSGGAFADDPFRANCKIKHIWRNYGTLESKMVESYDVKAEFMEDDDKYMLMGVPHVPMTELPRLFFFRHTLSGPLGQPTNETPAGTGISHVVINNTDLPVRLLVVGDTRRKDDRGFYPKDPLGNEILKSRGTFWADASQNEMGPHAGTPNIQFPLASE